MAEKQIIIISGHRPKGAITYVTRLYLNSDEASARRQFEADGGEISTCQSLEQADVIEWRSTLSGVDYTTDLSSN